MRYSWLLFIPIWCLANIVSKEAFTLPDHINPHAPKQGEVRLPYVGYPKSTYPGAQSSNAHPDLSLVYETLIEKSELDDTYVTLLASEIKIFDDYIIVNLDEHAYFSNHKSITSHDVSYSIRLFQKEDTQHQLRMLSQNIQITLLDQHRMILHYDMPISDLWVLLSKLPILSKDENIGSGPYLLGESSPASIHYHRNPDYWGSNLPSKIGKYNFDHIEYKIYHSHYAASKAFEHNEVDYYLEHSAFNWHSKDNKTHRYQTLPHPKQRYYQILWYNYQKEPLNDPLVRIALDMLVEPSYINQWLFYGQYGTRPGPKTSTSYLRSMRRRMIQASAYLDAGGYTMKSDGYRYKDNQKLELELITRNKRLEPMLQLLKSHYRRIGIQLNIKLLSKTNYVYQKSSHDYHLILKSIKCDQHPKSLQDMTFLEHYQPATEFTSYSNKHFSRMTSPMFDTMLQTLEYKHVITPLWYIDCFRIGYHQDLRFIHRDQSFIDIHTWWYQT